MSTPLYEDCATGAFRANEVTIWYIRLKFGQFIVAMAARAKDVRDILNNDPDMYRIITAIVRQTPDFFTSKFWPIKLKEINDRRQKKMPDANMDRLISHLDYSLKNEALRELNMNKSYLIHYFPNNFFITDDFELMSNAMACLKKQDIQSANCDNLENSAFNDFLLSCLLMDLYPTRLYEFWKSLYKEVNPTLSALPPRYPNIPEEHITLNNDFQLLIAFFGI